MVDPKDTNERTVETDAGPELAARKVWVKPRVHTGGIEETAANVGVGHPTDGVNTCLS